MEPTVIQRSPRLWFAGGTLVFRAENTVYRLLPDILAACSPVFQDMFNVPQPSMQDSDGYEGLALIYMADKSDELTALFEAIFTPQFFQVFMPRAKATRSLTKTLAILKLSTKYQIDHLRYQSLRLLHVDYTPVALYEIDLHDVRADWKMALQIIPTVRQCNALWLLPSLYYTVREIPLARGRSSANGSMRHRLCRSTPYSARKTETT
ncbi:hypothetical protein BDV98DRAFT_573370 [Pterulicium gracile]|uniref:Uncharacterized protein n=1 Tax=Pterulicium gracile TaxID=1884261 RepID=A0A5C3QC74_9AGAR|nr:hypothetical protein BDV98DRAFT_573370 [Pterula gracilis]